MIIAHKNKILLSQRIKDGYRNFSMHTDFYPFNIRKKNKCEHLARNGLSKPAFFFRKFDKTINAFFEKLLDPHLFQIMSVKIDDRVELTKDSRW